MKLKKLLSGKALFQETNRIWIAKGMTFYAVDYSGKRVSPKYHLGSII